MKYSAFLCTRGLGLKVGNKNHSKLCFVRCSKYYAPGTTSSKYCYLCLAVNSSEQANKDLSAQKIALESRIQVLEGQLRENRNFSPHLRIGSRSVQKRPADDLLGPSDSHAASDLRAKKSKVWS